jgi:hypothetical protein
MRTPAPASSYSGMITRWYAIVFCALLFFSAAKGNSQLAGTGSIQGSIGDATGAVIQNATVTVTNVATQVKKVAVTGETVSTTSPIWTSALIPLR